MKRGILLLALLTLILGIFLTSGWAATGDAKNGKVVYDRACAKCHAADGTGQAAIAKALKVTFKPLGGEEIQKKTDADIKKDVVEGCCISNESPTPKMKKVPGLSDKDVEDVIAYVRSLAKK